MESKKAGAGLVIGIILAIIVILGIVCYFVFFRGSFGSNHINQGSEQISLVNPVQHIVAENTQNGKVNESNVVQQAVLEFNSSYIDYLISALGTSYLHSAVGFGNPKIELVMDSEIWNSELGDKMLTQKGNSDDPDIRIRMSKEEAVRALLSSDIKNYMKQSVSSGKTGIEMVSGKMELFSKGYLEMYNKLK